MPRKKIEIVGDGLLSEPEATIPEKEPEKVYPLEEPKKGPNEVLTPLIEEVLETDKAVKRNKECKDKIKSLLTDEYELVEFECEAGTAKISETVNASIDEESLIVDLKARGYGDFVKTKTVTYVDMEALERAMYEEDGTDETPITDLVRGRTTETVTKRLLVKANKPKKGGK